MRRLEERRTELWNKQCLTLIMRLRLRAHKSRWMWNLCVETYIIIKRLSQPGKFKIDY